MAVGYVRVVPASRADRPCTMAHLVGRWRLKRHAAPFGALRPMWRQVRSDPTGRIGGSTGAWLAGDNTWV